MSRAATQDAASSVEVYGFAGWIASALAFALYVAWAYLPCESLHALGVTYYPDKLWATVIPVWVLCTMAFVIWSYESLNRASVKPFHALLTIRDRTSKSYKAMGLSSPVDDARDSLAKPGSEEGSPPLPLVHIPAAVASRVLHAGRTVPQAITEEDDLNSAR